MGGGGDHGHAVRGIPVTALALLWRHRRILWTTTVSDMRARYRASLLGTMWLVLYPALFLATYASVFVWVLRIRVGTLDTAEYVLLIFCGLVPFLGFAESLSAGVGSVVSNPGLVKNTLFPIDLVPAKSTLMSHATVVVGLSVLAMLLAISGRAGWYLSLAPVVLALQLGLTLGVVWLISALNVFFRDLTHVVSVLVLVLMLASPIGYTEEMIPPGLRMVARLNPLYYLIGTYRELMLFDRLPPIGLAGPLVVTALGSLVVGYWVFSRLRPMFADHV
jgi:homopolymeric O-antigen transport system permease protein